MEDKLQDEQLYYIKFTRGHLVYIKDDKGRRIKTTFSDFYDSYDPDKGLNIHDVVELIPIDPKYEAEREKKELELALKKEQNVDPYQMELF